MTLQLVVLLLENSCSEWTFWEITVIEVCDRFLSNNISKVNAVTSTYAKQLLIIGKPDDWKNALRYSR